LTEDYKVDYSPNVYDAPSLDPFPHVILPNYIVLNSCVL